MNSSIEKEFSKNWMLSNRLAVLSRSFRACRACRCPSLHNILLDFFLSFSLSFSFFFMSKKESERNKKTNFSCYWGVQYWNEWDFNHIRFSFVRDIRTNSFPDIEYVCQRLNLFAMKTICHYFVIYSLI